MNIIDGKKVSSEIRLSLKEEISQISSNGKQIGLAVIIVGQDPASEVYVRNKINACEEVGIKSYHYLFDENITQNELLALIDKLNLNDEVNGILVQLPLPKHLDKEVILSRILPSKDVDGFSAEQSGNMLLGKDALVSCTPTGIIHLLKHYGVNIAGLNAVVVGRSNIVGKPVAMLLLQENATVTICHSRTKNLAQHTKNADLVVLAVGIPNFLTADMIKDGAIVVDAGINRHNGKLCGDADFDGIKDKCSLITPVPGGVGPMTVTMLLYNTVKAYKNAR